ncbi:MAG: hypothetical protein HOK83_19020, partial [Rhodospirillaceae bacterium]|nr:hypothetical protein [Rhodospirillaceae bacterium]
GSIIGPVIAGIGMDLWNPNGFIAAMAASALAFLVFGTWRYLTAPDPARRIEKQA